MPKRKETYEITLEADQISFIRRAKEKYDIPDESKVMRIIMDYVMINHSLHPTIFTEIRCRRCD